jgi:hypothetical protein
MLRRLSVILALSLGFSAILGAQSPDLIPDSLRVQRLASVGRLWGVVKLFHPAEVVSEGVEMSGRR